MPDWNRRRVLRNAGLLTASSGLVGLSGCLGDDDTDDTTTDDTTDGVDPGDDDEPGEQAQQIEYRLAGSHTAEVNCWQDDCPAPWSIPWEFMQRWEDETGGNVTGEFVGGIEICANCFDQLDAEVLDIAHGSYSGGTPFYPEWNVHQAPFMFDSFHAYQWAIVHSYMWEEYWIPFAQQYGVIPIALETAAPEHLFIGLDFASDLDGMVTSPEQLEGATIRTVGTPAYNTGLEALGATPTEIEWGDTVQGLESGVVDAAHAQAPYGVLFGFADMCDHILTLGPTYAENNIFASVDWLQSLSEENLAALADVSKALSIESHQMYEEWEQGFGIRESPPPAGSVVAETDTDVSILDDEQLQAFRDRMGYRENPELYRDGFQPGYELAGDDGLADTLVDLGQEAPSLDNFEMDAWWDEYLHEM